MMNKNKRRVYLFGQLQVEINQESITLRGGKIRALFAYLVLHPHQPHSREQLADILWPDAPIDRVRRNLSDTLYRLRQSLGDDWLDVDRERVRLRKEDLWVDTWQFERLTTTGQIDALSQAVSLYRDDLLPEIYDDWILGARLVLRETYLSSLLALGEAHETARDPQTAHHFYQQLVHADPLREEAHRGLMRSLANMGRLTDALAAYTKLEALLVDELSVPPTAETAVLATQLRNELTLTRKAAALPQDSLVQRPFTGRIPERTHILQAIDNLKKGQGGLIAVEGEAGIGKSRLLQEIAAGAEWRQVVVASGQAGEYPTASPFAPLANALADALTPPRPAQLATMLPAATLAAAAPLYPDWQSLADLPALPPQQNRDRFHQAIGEILPALARLAPHLIILDDMHWADAALWELLDALAPVLRQQPILFLLAYRRPDIEESAGWSFLPQWQQAGQIKVWPLRPLTITEVTELLPPSLQAEAEAVHASAGGRPFHISEMLIALAEGHAPYGRTAVTRAQALPSSAQHALNAAAVIGSEIPYSLWAAVADLPPAQLAQAGDLLTKHFLLQPQTGGYAFSHDLIHQAIRDAIAEEERQALHRQAAQALAQLEPDNLRARAFHLDQAGAAEATAVYQQVGEQDMANFAFAAAQESFARALALTPETATPRRAELLLALAEACHITGSREQETEALQEAQVIAKTLQDDDLLRQVLIRSGKAEAKTGQHEAAIDHLNQALILAREAGDQDIEMEAIMALGDLSIRGGKLAEAKEWFETAVSLAQKIGRPELEGRALDGIAFVMMNQGQEKTAVDVFQRAITLQEDGGDQLGAARSLVNLLSTYHTSGAWDQVLAQAERVYAAQQAVGYRLGMGATRQTQGLAACSLGDFAAAQTYITQARENFAAAKDQMGVGFAVEALGLVAERQGDWEPALDFYRQALEIAEAAQSPTSAAFVHQDLGFLLVQMGRYDEAIPLLETAVPHWQKHGDDLNRLKCETCLALAQLETGQEAAASALADSNWQTFRDSPPSGTEPQTWYWALHRLLDRLGRQDEAGQLLEAAYNELQSQAQAISDNEMRRRFFALVPDNRTIVAAYDRCKKIQRTATISLVHEDVPLGRPLQPEDKITIQWTVNAPEDEAITGKTDRRQYQLCRLLREAEQQHGAPTDDDLAQALDVSRRTILRDMETLKAAGLTLPTRRRG